MMSQPLAERLRPKTLDDYIGQKHLVGQGAVLRKMIDAGRVPSFILWGPPGVGKTTLAQIIANKLDAPFYTLSAISSGVKDVREVIEKAKSNRFFNTVSPILFIDEIHRFSKSQQDSLLNAVETGVVTLIGATTENPSFEVIRPLLSRCQVYVLKSLDKNDLLTLLHKAIAEDVVLKDKNIRLTETDAMLRYSGGDARKLLNILELVVSAEESDDIEILDEKVVERLQENPAAYDKGGEMHYDIISAFIKSIRGSDPDGAIYWLARMVAGGEDPEFIARRLVISASEDIGLANPNALLLANACFDALKKIGWPEGRIILAETTVYLACSPKSNSAYMAINDALALVNRTGNLPVPLHLRNAPTKLMAELEYGKEYKYAHDYENHFVKQEYLPKEAYKAVTDAIEKGTPISREIADLIANGMKSWAKSLNVTHYTHWFQPLTDGTAEKHDGFIEFGEDGGVIERFSGKLLIQQEPDASSFPNGGIRNTFEARGYTAWDVSSPAFVVDTTLCIPTIFISYTGEALDYKTPLLKALAAVDKAATEVCQLFDKNVTRVFTNLGWEQEYFLVDSSLYNARPDLCLTGRTLMGHSSAKDQQLEDHYFGSIPPRVTAFMKELEIECHKLGIPAKTRHNEVAPNQFELAPIFENANLANDHNQLVMDLMKRIARKHNFAVLLHEKPYSGVNGSGKHNNWSLCTDTGINLFAPGKNPKGNMLFLTFLVNVLMMVYKNQNLLRASIMSAGNSHRLGANEAPPAILSIFLGRQLSATLDDIVRQVGDDKMTAEEKTTLKLGIGRIPEILLDTTDRNRTSPFAFTGNRFEFRAAGSSSNCAAAMIAINAAMANQLNEFKASIDKLMEEGIGKDEAIFRVLKETIIASEAIRFEGDGYSDQWKKEAARRGLTNICHVPEALMHYMDNQSRSVLIGERIFNETELACRLEVELEKYTMKVQIESRVLGDLAINHIVPIAVSYQNRLLENLRGLKEIFSPEEYEVLSADRKELIREISKRVTSIKVLVREMTEARKVANHMDSYKDKAFAYEENVRPYLEKIRDHIDHLEMEVDDEIWPLPKYRELLFTK